MPDNWSVERQKLKDEIMKDLRRQRDSKGRIQLSGTIKVVPTGIKAGNFKVLQPVRFETNFQVAPAIGFSNVLTDTTKTFIAQPYIYKWLTTSGLVEGFYPGLYGLMDCPSGLLTHILTWTAVGKASQYRGDTKTESWRYSYNEARPTHLEGKAL